MQTQIQNEDGEKIESINSISNIPYSKPYLIFDILKPKHLKPEIKIIQSPFDLKELYELGICLYSTPVKKGQTWSPRQKIRYYLRYLDLPSSTDSKIIKKLPINHILENDIANNLIRLTGRFISKDSNKTEWFRY